MFETIYNLIYYDFFNAAGSPAWFNLNIISYFATLIVMILFGIFIIKLIFYAFEIFKGLFRI